MKRDRGKDSGGEEVQWPHSYLSMGCTNGGNIVVAEALSIVLLARDSDHLQKTREDGTKAKHW